MHLITERTGLPLAVAISAAGTHDSLALEPLVRGIPPRARRRQPGKLHGGKGYDHPHLRAFLRGRGPDPALRSHAACLWSAGGRSHQALPVLPDGCVDLIWALINTAEFLHRH